MRNQMKNRKLEWGVFCLFTCLYIFVSVFHEPWFDEAQAWQIAKCASFSDIFFTVPHYEGHPPLWYLLLAIPARLGVPFEIGLKSIGFLISTTSTALILFRSCLPKPVRLLLPFSFFFFYQYGVIVRPYGLLLLLLILLGQDFHYWNTCPARVIVILMMLCLTSAYGIVIAGGIAIGLVWDLLREKGPRKAFGEIFVDHRSLSLLLLLLIAVVLSLELLPREDTWITSAEGENSRILCFICAFLTFVGDCFITDSPWFSVDIVLLQNVHISFPDLLLYCVIGIGILLLIVSISSRRNIKFFLLPYTLFSLFSAFVYFSAHHVGIAFSILLFWLEIDLRDKERFEVGRPIIRALAKSDRDRRLLFNAGKIIVLACLLTPIYWTISATVREIKLEYSYGRTIASFLIENNLDNALILSSWGENSSEKYGERINDENYLNTYENSYPVLVCAYFDRNICMNLGDGSDQEAFMQFRLADEKPSTETMKKWAAKGTPELLIGKPKLKVLYGDKVTGDEFSLVLLPEVNYIWKNNNSHGVLPIYLRNDLFESHRLRPLENMTYGNFYGIPAVTKEIREQYENGVPVDEILKPYADAILGGQ